MLNAKHYGIPQNRERVYLIFIKKELDNGEFKFPVPFDNGTRLKDILENKVDEKYYISEEKVKKFIKNIHTYESNSIVVDVLYYIFIELYKVMPYLFDDLRLSSFFSGIGAFECALDRFP